MESTEYLRYLQRILEIQLEKIIRGYHAIKLNPSNFYIKRKLFKTYLYENSVPLCNSFDKDEIKKLYFEICSGIIKDELELRKTINERHNERKLLEL